MRVAGVSLLIASLVGPVAAQDPPAPPAVLVWGHGAARMDLVSGATTPWLDDTHVVQKVCWMAGPGHAAATVFVVEDGQVTSLDADTGRPVVEPASGEGDGRLPVTARPVVSRHVIGLAARGDLLCTVQLDRAPDGAGSGRPFQWCGDPMLPWLPAESGWLNEAPDRVGVNLALERRGLDAVVFAALSPAHGLGPRLWNAEGEVPRPEPKPVEETWFVQGFAMAETAPRCYALMASPFAQTRLMACDFTDGLASGTWTTVNTKPPEADPQFMSLYLCSGDGAAVLIGNGYRIDVIDGVHGGRRTSLALQGVVRDSDAVLDLCLLPLPDGSVWVAGLCRALDEHGSETGGLKVAAWDLATGQLKRCFDAPRGMSQLTALGAGATDTARDAVPGAGPGAGPR